MSEASAETGAKSIHCTECGEPIGEGRARVETTEPGKPNPTFEDDRGRTWGHADCDNPDLPAVLPCPKLRGDEAVARALAGGAAVTAAQHALGELGHAGDVATVREALERGFRHSLRATLLLGGILYKPEQLRIELIETLEEP